MADRQIRQLSELQREEEVPTSPTNLKKCPICQKNFSAERIKRHQEICEKNSQKKTRTSFDSKQQRRLEEKK